MPGELGDEQTGPFVGYYEQRYKPTGEWNLPEYGKVPKDDDPDDSTQIGRILKRLRKSKKKVR